MEWGVFRAVETAVKEALLQGGLDYRIQVDAASRLIIQSYSNSGLNSERATRLPFASGAVRWAYTYLYVTSHTHMVLEILGRFWRTSDSLDAWHDALVGSKARVCCIGGGPGSDVLAVALFIQKYRLQIAGIEGDVLDQWTQWEDTFVRLAKRLDPRCVVLPRRGVKYSTYQFNEDDSWTELDPIRHADLVMMVKFVSAVASNRDGCQSQLAMMFLQMKEGSLLFVLDNAGGGFLELVERAAEAAGLVKVCQILHEDLKLPEAERLAIDSSSLRLAGMKPQKSSKVSAFLWRKGAPWNAVDSARRYIARERLRELTEAANRLPPSATASSQLNPRRYPNSGAVDYYDLVLILFLVVTFQPELIRNVRQR